MTFLYLFENKDDWKPYVGTRMFFEKDVTGFSPYHHYLQSKSWQARRKKKLKSANYRCERCGEVQQKSAVLHVHHLTYTRVTKERMGDLQVLCRDCHLKVHENS